MANTTKNCSELELTEYIGMRASYELLNKTYRKNHRELERANTFLNKSFEKFSGVKTYGEAVEFIGRVMHAVCGSKRKAEEIYNEEIDLVASCKRRIDHLKEASKLEGKTLCGPLAVDNPLRSVGMAGSIFCETASNDSSNVPARPHSQLEALTSGEQCVFIKRFHRLLADHLFAEGHYKAALGLAKDIDGESLDSIYEEAANIHDALIRGETDLAHKWYQEVNYKMKKHECFFEFDLRVFELYLLVKAGRYLEAIQHARKYLNTGKQVDDYQTRRLGQAMVLLVMRTPEEVEAKAAQNELNEQWITKQFHSTLINFYSFSSPTPFSLAVKAGITAIKTHFCYSAMSRHPDCVVCHPLINRLALNLPFGRHDHSVLTCYQTGLPMNDDSPPMALPNGYVYSEKALSDLATPDGMITCPRSGETCHISAAQRVYIL